jgi:hypothetical protein
MLQHKGNAAVCTNSLHRKMVHLPYFLCLDSIGKQVHFFQFSAFFRTPFEQTRYAGSMGQLTLNFEQGSALSARW